MGKITKEDLNAIITAIVRKEVAQLIPTIAEGVKNTVNKALEPYRKILAESGREPIKHSQNKSNISNADLQASLRSKLGLEIKPTRMHNTAMNVFEEISSGEIDDEADSSAIIPLTEEASPPQYQPNYLQTDDVLGSESVITTALSGNIKTPAAQKVANAAIRDYSSLMKRINTKGNRFVG